MPFLALDVGNSSVKAALWGGGAWSAVVRMPGDAVGADVWAERLAALGVADRVGIASVVPELTDVIADGVRAAFGFEPTVVSAALPLPFRLAYATPHTLGADRIAAAVAGHAVADGRAVVVIDAGTAITAEAVTAEPAYLGGAILPGPDLLRRALARGTGQLPDVPWPDVPSAVGDSTVTAIQAGLATLVADGVAGLIRRTIDAVGGDAAVIATGGWAPWLARHVADIDRVEPTLVLDGVRLLADGVDG